MIIRCFFVAASGGLRDRGVGEEAPAGCEAVGRDSDVVCALRAIYLALLIIFLLVRA